VRSPAETGPGGVPEKYQAAFWRDVRHPAEVPLSPFAGVEGVLDAPPDLRVLVHHEPMGEAPLVGLVVIRTSFRSAPYDLLLWSPGVALIPTPLGPGSPLARSRTNLAIALCTAAKFLGLLVGQGAIPGSYDAFLDGVKEALQDSFDYQAMVEQAAKGILLVDVSTKRVLDANTTY
jgi:hypothetical protein